MRIVWKDSDNNRLKPMKYRNHLIEGTYSGWYTDLPGDDNLYRTVYDAMNAIDEILGYQNLRYAKRRERGITIVGKKKKSS